MFLVISFRARESFCSNASLECIHSIGLVDGPKDHLHRPVRRLKPGAVCYGEGGEDGLGV
jgi:hypothetical protein